MPFEKVDSGPPAGYRALRRKGTSRCLKPGFLAIMLSLLISGSNAGYSSCHGGWYGCSGWCCAYFGGYGSPSSCPAGNWCEKGTTSRQTCPAGYRCPSGSEYPLQCGQGTYSNNGWGSCSNCGGNNKCNMDGVSGCSGGWFASSSTSRWRVCHRCPPGYYCSGGAIYVTPRGKYNTYAEGSPNGCSANNYCPDPGDSTTQSGCPTGTYSSANSNYCSVVSDGYYKSGSSQAACPNGQYSAPGVTGCQNCPSGHYCVSPTANPTPCASGTYQPSSG